MQNDFESVFQRFSHSTEDVSSIIEEISVAPELKRIIEGKIRSLKSEIAACDVAIQEFTDDLILSGQYAAAGKNTEVRDAWLRKQIKSGLSEISLKREQYISLLSTQQGELDDVRRRVDSRVKVLGFLQAMIENATSMHVVEEQSKGCEFARRAVDYLEDAKKTGEEGMLLHRSHMENENKLMGEMGKVLKFIGRDN